MRSVTHVLLALYFWLITAPSVQAWDSDRLSTTLKINEFEVPYPRFSIFLMPGKELRIERVNAAGHLDISFEGQVHSVEAFSRKVPEKPGLYSLEIRDQQSGEVCHVNVFVLVSAKQLGRDGRLNGYRIGAYPEKPLGDQSSYQSPEGFAEVRLEFLDTRLSPNFSLRDFVSKQSGGYPKYLIIRPQLLLKLENILASLNRAGHPISDLVVMSGYRTPFYNRTIGNVPRSRHVYGGAADIYIDQDPADGIMDDLNDDGRLDRGDAKWLADFIDGMSRRGEFGPRIGGLGIYGRTAAHGAFVHVDVRGTRARW